MVGLGVFGRRRRAALPELDRAAGPARPVAAVLPADRREGGRLLLPVDGLVRHGALVHAAAVGPRFIRPADLADPLPVGLRGVVELTVLLAGQLEHRDALGNRGALTAPAALLVAGGGGIISETGPSRDLRRDGGDLHVVTLRWLQGAVAVPTVRQGEGAAARAQGRSTITTWCGPDGLVPSADGVVVHTVRVAVGAVVDLAVAEDAEVLVASLSGRVLVGPDLVPVGQGDVAVLGGGGSRLQLATSLGLAADEAPLVLVVIAPPGPDRVLDRAGTIAADDEAELAAAREQAQAGAFGSLPGLDG